MERTAFMAAVHTATDAMVVVLLMVVKLEAGVGVVHVSANTNIGLPLQF